MRLILLLLVVGFAAQGCCEEGDKPTIACYKGAFSKSDGTGFRKYLELVSAQSCFTYFSTDCSIILHDELKTDANFTDLFNTYITTNTHIADYTIVECNSDGCNYNMEAQMKQLMEINNTLYEECFDKYTKITKQERQTSSIYCYKGEFSDAKGDSQSQDLELSSNNNYCSVGFKSDCSIFLEDEGNEEDTWLTCDSDGCNYNMTSMMSKLQDKNVTLYNECNKTYEKAMKHYKPLPVLTSNLMCAFYSDPKKSWNSGWRPLEIAKSRPFCEIEFNKGHCLSFVISSYAKISTLNTCLKRSDGKAIACLCTSGDFCNTDIEKWTAEARNVQGSDFMNECDYTGYNYPQPWRFTTTTEATTTEATTIEATTTSTTVETTTSKSPQNEPPVSNSVPLLTAASFVLLLLVA